MQDDRQIRRDTFRHSTLGEYLSAKRREKEITSLQVAETVKISPGYYCDIEKNRKNPSDLGLLACIAKAIYLSDEETAVLYDLAGKARSEAPPDLPAYINENQVVRVALRLAKEKGSADDWHDFIRHLESRQPEYEARENPHKGGGQFATT